MHEVPRVAKKRLTFIMAVFIVLFCSLCSVNDVSAVTSTHCLILSALTAVLSPAQHGTAPISHQLLLLSHPVALKINVARQILSSYCVWAGLSFLSPSLCLHCIIIHSVLVLNCVEVHESKFYVK